MGLNDEYVEGIFVSGEMRAAGEGRNVEITYGF